MFAEPDIWMEPPGVVTDVLSVDKIIETVFQ